MEYPHDILRGSDRIYPFLHPHTNVSEEGNLQVALLQRKEHVRGKGKKSLSYWINIPAYFRRNKPHRHMRLLESLKVLRKTDQQTKRLPDEYRGTQIQSGRLQNCIGRPRETEYVHSVQ